MTRYYSKTYAAYKHGLITDCVSQFFAIYWDHKKKKHSFVGVASLKDYPHHDFGTPVVFECEAHEREFLDFHPDAAPLRQYYKYGYFYKCVPQTTTAEKLPFEFRKGRWCWKKAAATF